MTVADLRKALVDVPDDLEVVLRIDDDDYNMMIGSARSARVDPGCTEVDAFVIDGQCDEAETSQDGE